MKEHSIFPPWSIGKWEAVDDRVRGGSSKSHLEEMKITNDDVDSVLGEKGHGKSGARFWGTLDTKTLGGAGFASQRYGFSPTPLSLPRWKYQGLCIHATLDRAPQASSPKVFTIVLNSSVPPYPDPKPTPGPRPSVLSYEANFTPKHTGKRLDKICISWDEFEPTYRGRKVPKDDPKWKALETDTIFELSIMCRSAFGKQEGDFSLVLGGISGWKSEEAVKAREGCWASMKGWMSGLWKSQEGGVRLADDEKQ